MIILVLCVLGDLKPLFMAAMGKLLHTFPPLGRRQPRGSNKSVVISKQRLQYQFSCMSVCHITDASSSNVVHKIHVLISILRPSIYQPFSMAPSNDAPKKRFKKIHRNRTQIYFRSLPLTPILALSCVAKKIFTGSREQNPSLSRSQAGTAYVFSTS